MNFKEFFTEAGKILTKQGIELSRVNKQDFLTAKSTLQPILQKAGLHSYWSAGGAGSFDPEHPYGGGGREDSGDIDILIDPTELIQKFPKDIKEYVEEHNSTVKNPIGPKALAKILSDPIKKHKEQLAASKWELAKYMSNSGYSTSTGSSALTINYKANGKNHSIDLITDWPREAWPLHTYDFSNDSNMRGGDLWNNVYPAIAILASDTIDPKTGKGNIQYSPARGLVNRNTGEVITINKDEMAKILLGPTATGKDLASLTGIKNKLINQPEKWNAIKEFYSNPQESYSVTSKVLMEGIEHPEDSIIKGGVAGAEKTFKELASLVKNSDTVTIKWDGFPAVIFGWKQKPTKTNPEGQFLFVDKHMFDKMVKGKLEFTTIEEYDKSRGATRQSLWEAAAVMAPSLKRCVPQKENEYFFGDLMWSGMPKTESGYYSFEPNTVKYKVKIDSTIGHRISRSVGGIAVHTFVPGMGEEDRPLKGLQGLKQDEGITFLVGEIEEKPKIALSENILNYTKGVIQQHKPTVERFLEEITAMKAKSVISAMGPFITFMLSENNLAENIVPRFLTFLKTKLSEGASLKLLGTNKDGWLYKEGAAGLLGVWSIWAALTELKINIKRQIDLQQFGLPIQARIGEEDSHEGYVFGSGKDKLKLIDRLGFSRANFAKNANNEDELVAKRQMTPAAFCFGRMNPPTLGHSALMKKTIQEGGNNSFIFLSNTQNSKKDPLNPETKAEFVKKIYPEYASYMVDEKVLNPIYAANYLYRKGFRNMIFVAGSDRLGDNPGSLEKILISWNSGPVRSKDFNTDPKGREQVALTFVSSGDRDPDTTEGISGISGSLARKMASENNEQGFQQATGVSNNITVDGKTLYQATKEGMGLPLTEGVISFKEFFKV